MYCVSTSLICSNSSVFTLTSGLVCVTSISTYISCKAVICHYHHQHFDEQYIELGALGIERHIKCSIIIIVGDDSLNAQYAGCVFHLLQV